jgi:hypothetical protein
MFEKTNEESRDVAGKSQFGGFSITSLIESWFAHTRCNVSHKENQTENY